MEEDFSDQLNKEINISVSRQGASIHFSPLWQVLELLCRHP